MSKQLRQQIVEEIEYLQDNWAAGNGTDAERGELALLGVLKEMLILSDRDRLAYAGTQLLLSERRYERTQQKGLRTL